MSWPWVLGGLGVLGALGLLISRGEALGVGREAVPVGPPPPMPRGQITGSGPVTLVPGRTYFATIETNGSVDAAASLERVKAAAEKQGFSDVAVFEDARPDHWPLGVDGDYYVRGTYGAALKTFPRHVSVTLGSVNVLDAFEA